MTKSLSLMIRHFTHAARMCGKCMELVVCCWLAAGIAWGQTGGMAPVGENGHLILRPQSREKSGAPKALPSSTPSLAGTINPLNSPPSFPGFSIKQPASLGAEPNREVSAVTSSDSTKPLRFPIQKPLPLADLPQQTQNVESNELSDQVRQLLDQGYQAVSREDYQTAVSSFRQATQLEPKNGKIWFEYAYALSHLKQLPDATDALHRVIQLDPVNVAARSQLGYLLIEQGRLPEAIETFLAAESLEPGNYSFKLQLGYLYDRANDKLNARIKFIQASHSPDLELHQKAVDALKALAPVVFSRQWLWTNEIYAAPTYYQRFNNLVTPFIFRSGLILSDRNGLEGYLSLRATRDLRSSGGNLPQIFEDNFAVVGLGLRARPFKSALTLYGEAGLAINLMPSRLATVKTRNDIRLGTYYSRLWGKRTPDDKLRFPFNPIGEIYFDVSYYSRFRHNVIGYLQTREGLRILQAQQTSLEAYGRFNLVKDSNRDFFNNLVEAGVGLGLVPKQKWGIKLTAEYLRGYYLGPERRGEINPYGPRYGDLRFAIIYGKYFVKE